MITVTFDERELQALLALLDISVKAGGLQAAPAAVVFQQKITTAMQEPQATVYHKTIDGEFVEAIEKGKTNDPRRRTSIDDANYRPA